LLQLLAEGKSRAEAGLEVGLRDVSAVGRDYVKLFRALGARTPEHLIALGFYYGLIVQPGPVKLGLKFKIVSPKRFTTPYKISEQQIEEAKALYLCGMTVKEISRKTKISWKTLYRRGVRAELKRKVAA
jgi:hypothetical protein